MTDEGQTKEEKDGGGFGSIVLWIVVVLVMYVLSIGPAAWLNYHTKWAVDPELSVIYAPLMWAKNTPLEPILEWWVNKWVPDKK
jgi:hypothetical protein